MTKLLATLLIASAVLFGTGVAMERSAPDVHSESTTNAHDEGTESAARGESEEAEDSHSESEESQAAEDTTQENSESDEDIFGVNPEANATVGVAIAASLMLAALVLWMGSPIVWTLAGAFALVAAGLDIREVMHQLDESHEGIAAVAAGVAALHIAALVVAARLVLGRRTNASTPAN